MNMVIIKPDFQKNLIPFLYTEANLLERVRNFIVEQLSPIFDQANKMIQQQTFVMTLMNMLAHNHKNTYQYATPRHSLEEF